MSKLDQTRIQLERRVTSDDQAFTLFILNLNECLWYLSQVQVWNYTKYLLRDYAIEPLNKEFQITIYDYTFFRQYQYFQQFQKYLGQLQMMGLGSLLDNQVAF